MSKYCHDDGIHMCLVECEGCSAYYDDKESENYLVTEKDQKNFIEEVIRADERKKVLEEIEELYRDWLYFEYGKKADTDNLAIRVINHLKEQKNV